MSSWYKTGTASFTNGNTAVVGVGTAFIANVAPGEAIQAPDGRFYEIDRVSSDTGLVLAAPYLGATVSGQTYTIMPSQSYLRDLANLAAELVNSFGDVLANAGAGKFSDGTLAAPGIRFSADEDTGFFRSGANEVTFVANSVAQFKYSSTTGITFLKPVTAAVAGGSINGVPITGGSVNNTPIGQTTPAAGSFTALSATSSNAVPLTANYTNTGAFGGLQVQRSGVTKAYLGLDASDNPRLTNAGGVNGLYIDQATGAGSFTSGLSVTGGVNATSTLRLGNTGAADTQLRAGALNASTTYFQAISSDGTTAKAYKWYSGSLDAMNLSASGNLLVGVSSGNNHVLSKAATNDAGDTVLQVFGLSGNDSIRAYAVSVGGFNPANAALGVGKDGVTGRSIKVGGTITSNGNDCAEYERISAPYLATKILKGAVVGFTAIGELTLKFSEAIRFGVKSTDPHLVGGDTWGSEGCVGKRPEQPCYVAPTYEGLPKPGEKPVEPVLTLPSAPSRQDGETDETFAIREAQWQETCAAATTAHQTVLAAYEEALAAWETAYAAWQTDDASYQGKVTAAKAAHEAAMTQYAADLADFEIRLETARQQVDRVAYSGKVPVNVLGATPGGYIVAASDADGAIAGEFVADPDFAQYKRAVGRVNRILDDGRAEVAVMVH